tara:strand:- start:1504 stop:2388 length:885 start_codon:yes stop_codon:yes gene_type:complete
MLDKIVEAIRKKNTRWDGLVQLKELTETSETDRFIYYCDDSFWLIRWAIIEKIGDLKLTNCLDKLFEKLSDPDSHVRKNTKKAILKCIKHDIQPIIQRVSSTNYHISIFCKTFLSKHIDSHFKEIQEAIFYQPWIIANQLLHIFFLEKKEKSEKLLMKATKIKNTQKHAIMMLAIINSEKGIAYFIMLYNQGSLKRHIINAIQVMDPTIIYPKLIEYLEYPSTRKNVQSMMIKCGKPCVPYIIQSIHKAPFTEELLYCLKKMTITVPVYTLLEKKVSNYPSLAKKINLNNLKPK